MIIGIQEKLCNCLGMIHLIAHYLVRTVHIIYTLYCTPTNLRTHIYIYILYVYIIIIIIIIRFGNYY